MKKYHIEWTADLFGHSTVEAESEEQAVANLRAQSPAVQDGKWFVRPDWDISEIDISEVEEVAASPEPPSDDDPARSGGDGTGFVGELTQRVCDNRNEHTGCFALRSRQNIEQFFQREQFRVRRSTSQTIWEHGHFPVFSRRDFQNPAAARSRQAARQMPAGQSPQVR
ncbi:MAG: hypothetical protein ACLQNE_04505 [Thermoguttaceae bacterium]